MATVKVLALGDSNTAAGAYVGDEWPMTLVASLHTAHPSNTYTLTNHGVSGTSTQDVVADLSGYVGAHSPDLVCMMLGTNDVYFYNATDAATYGHAQQTLAGYEANLRSIIAYTLALSVPVTAGNPTGHPKFVLMQPPIAKDDDLPTNIYPYGREYTDLIAAKNLVTSLATEYGIPCVATWDDLAAYFSWDGSVNTSTAAMIDGVHLSSTAHARVASLAASAAGALLDSSGNIAPGGLVLAADSHWSQDGTALTVSAPRGVLTSVRATAISTLGGTLKFTGTDAAKFTCSLDGETFAATQTLGVGTTTVYLGVTPGSDDGALTASVGVWS